ncbi:MAG: division/cell wall cluster transcriptional repressor MraZ [Anaerolineales bacterium]|nr:division/cell wall cluster transcriptional repressor MraZ [Anaerolineales bacterium]
MFLGQYQHSLDEKGRLTIPAKFREELAEGAYLTQGFDRNLRLVTEAAFEALSGKLNHLSTTDPFIRQLRRLLFSNATRVEADRIGRVLIPQFLRDFAKLDGEAVIVGVGEAVEIWSLAGWQEQLDQLQDAETNAQRFAEFDLSL